MNKLYIGVIGAVLALSVTSQAESLKEKQEKTKEQALIKPTVDEMNQKCGTKLSVTFDWASFKGKVSDDQGHHVASTCDILPRQIGLVCDEGDDAKAAVKKGITAIKCVGTADKNQSISFKSKALIMTTPLQYDTGVDVNDIKALIHKSI